MNWMTSQFLRRLSALTVVAAMAALVAFPMSTVLAADDEGYVSLFDGKTLDGWDGNPEFWRVEDGMIVGETTPEKPTKGNTFLVWRGGTPGDFELKVECKLYNHNSGIQFRSFENPEKWGKWVLGGYQTDIFDGERYAGILYGEKFRGILAHRGDKTVIGDDHKPRVVGKVGDPAELLKYIKLRDWNEYHVVAKGNVITHSINGHQMIECVDDDKTDRRFDGLLGLQLHAGPPMKVAFRSIRLKELNKPAAQQAEAGAKKKIVFLAGRKSHGYNGHEHYAGCVLLAKRLQENVPNVETVVVKEGWPQDASVLDDADAIVVFCDGGGGHVLMPHLAEIDKLMKKGVGLALLHYGVEITKGEPGDKFLDWTGGYFEIDWSVNPHWTGEFKEFPAHPVTQGVKPFTMNDEWYYHMRFRDGMKDVTPVLTAIPPDSTRERPDGPHSNNPTVRARKGMPEHLGWVATREDGGRGFGFTGGHWHHNWACDSFRTLVLNGIAWVAKIDIPEGGVPSKTPTVDELLENQDYPKPENFSTEKIQKQIDEWNK